jgi:hypothetical protein
MGPDNEPKPMEEPADDGTEEAEEDEGPEEEVNPE